LQQVVAVAAGGLGVVLVDLVLGQAGLAEGTGGPAQDGEALPSSPDSWTQMSG
jgi:hypothetical protein